MKSDFDIVISGAGMVGATLAALLARHPGTRSLSIAVIDSKPCGGFSADQPVGLRVSALSRASQNILTAAGAWPLIARQRISAYREMRVWDARPDNKDDPDREGVHFDSAWLGEPDLGHIVENDLVGSALQQILEASDAVTLLRPAKLAAGKFNSGQVVLEVDDLRASWSGESHELSAGLLVGCDGAGSQVRGFAGIEVERASYSQLGLVAVLATEKPHMQTAWQRFLPTGPVALLPLANGDCSLVWSCSEDRAKRLAGLADEEFERAVTEASNAVLGNLSLRSERASFPLQRLHALRYCGAGVALAGDAAHVVHPLAGQGANLGLLDAAALVDTLAAAVENGESPGDLRVLRRYERWRKGDNLAMLAGLDGISKLFSHAAGPIAALRRAGMAAVAKTSPARNRLARHALGLGGELPQAARPNSESLRAMAEGFG